MHPAHTRRPLILPSRPFIVLFSLCLVLQAAGAQVRVYLTNQQRTSLVSPQTEALPLAPMAPQSAASPLTTIRIANQPLQHVEGFGYTLTHGSADLLAAMSPVARHALLADLFGNVPGQMNLSIVRLPIGTSDLSRSLYTLDDTPFDTPDPKLRRFSLARDRASLLPVCREILAIHPGIHFIAAPWTAPLWMKESLPGRRFADLRSREFVFTFALVSLPPALLFAVAALMVSATKRRKSRKTLAALSAALLLLAAAAWSTDALRRLASLLPPLDAAGGHVPGNTRSILADGQLWYRGRWYPGYYPAYLRIGLELYRKDTVFVLSSLRSMLTDGKEWRAGQLQRRYYPVYAHYFVRYLQAMRQEGIPIDSITIQNESESNANKPSMGWTAAQQNLFVRDALGPALRTAGLQTRIVIYDHNAIHPEFPLLLLRDPRTNPYIDGTSFHLYQGQMSALSRVHDQFPQKNIDFTEQMVIEDTRGGVLWPAAEPTERILIAALRNWSRSVLLWNLASTPNAEPHEIDGGCPACLGAVAIEGDRVTRNLGYHVLAQIARFVPEGSVVLLSNDTLPQRLANVALRTPDGRIVLLVSNQGPPQTFAVNWDNRRFTTTLQHNTVATYVWTDHPEL